MAVRNLLVIFGLLLGSAVCAASASITTQYQVVNNFPVKIVAVNMNDPEVVVTTATAKSFPNGLETWGSFLTRLQPDAAINGTYFCPRSAQPVGDVAVNGNLVYRGAVGTAFCITPSNQVAFLPGPRQAKSNWAGFQTILCAGPRLLTDGRPLLNARAEGFRDPHVLGSAPRSAIALRDDGYLLLLTIERNISLENLAYVCMHLGAVHAMALDGGSSSGLYAGGRTLTRPSRSISNILAVYATQRQYQAAARQLVPSSAPVVARLLDRPFDHPQVSPYFAAGFKMPTMPSVPVRITPTTPPLAQFLEPDPTRPVHGAIPVTVKFAKDTRIGWCSLRINGKLRAMTANTNNLEYKWDSTQEPDGTHTLEVTVWSNTHELLGMETQAVLVQNTSRVAEKSN